MIDNRQYRISRSGLAGLDALPEAVAAAAGRPVLRWYVCEVTRDEIVCEATTCAEAVGGAAPPAGGQLRPGRSAVVSIIPTGVGCHLGGYAGDAAPVTNLLAATADYLITNPNSVNASNFVGLNSPNIVYTDGCSLDLFARGAADLHLPHRNRVGLVIEQADAPTLDIVYNVVNAVRAVHGVNLTDIVVTEGPIGGRCVENQSGAFVGTVDNPRVLFEACEKLIRNGVNAVAITSRIRELPLDSYVKHFDGEYPNPVGGVEAVISYLTTTRFRLPSAHAPILNLEDLDLRHNVVDARGAGEHASASGLACVLVGLRRAPQLDPGAAAGVADVLGWRNVMAVVAPAGCLGGVPVIYALRHRIPVIAVEQNRTIYDVTKSRLGAEEVVEVRNYAEAAGVILALKQGLSLESISRPLATHRPQPASEVMPRLSAAPARAADLTLEPEGSLSAL
ncbi:MAG TPA: DUF3326 domain-containing protein [Pyrinomonadaceae bacterium]|nr:DUF3326 domain-containing protein [Pyrinomonadaceae bacterium]